MVKCRIAILLLSFIKVLLELCYKLHDFRTNSIFFSQTIQILLGIFHVLMWYFLLILYMGQIRGVFGTYEPLTYRVGCTLWGIFVSRMHLYNLIIQKIMCMPLIEDREQFLNEVFRRIM